MRDVCGKGRRGGAKPFRGDLPYPEEEEVARDEASFSSLSSLSKSATFLLRLSVRDLSPPPLPDLSCEGDAVDPTLRGSIAFAFQRFTSLVDSVRSFWYAESERNSSFLRLSISFLCFELAL